MIAIHNNVKVFLKHYSDIISDTGLWSFAQIKVLLALQNPWKFGHYFYLSWKSQMENVITWW